MRHKRNRHILVTLVVGGVTAVIADHILKPTVKRKLKVK